MTLEKELAGHSGCINTLDWSALGDLLLTGSDDTQLNIYSSYDNYKMLHTIDTGHTANIFTAKFMPQTSNRIILSGAGDAELRIFDVTNPRTPLNSMYVCHSDQLRRICTLPDNPHEFFTCSLDGNNVGTVRHFDLRTPHVCSPHNLNSMSISKLYPHYFALAGMSDFIFLHDRRMLASSSTVASLSTDMTRTSKCIMRFSPRTDKTSRINRHITACKFSDSNGYELIGSWSSDAIYLFNINDSPDELMHQNNLRSSQRRHMSSLSSEEGTLNRQRKRKISEENDASNPENDEDEDEANDDSDEHDDGDDDDDDDDDSFYPLDLNELDIFRKRGQLSLETETDVVKPRSKFFGHLNVETIKDVNFYGPRDEYVVSGSDGGYLFVWDKKTTKLVEILHADEEVVNVVKGHPSLPILAVSGIDSTTKIFTPTSRLFSTSRKKEPKQTNSYSTSSRMHESQDIMRANREANTNSSTDIFITQSMIAALTRHRLTILAGDDSDDDEDSDNATDEDIMYFQVRQ
ncbi:WD40-repeat-containing domain protein [Choanephora cucurbitarum]|nr:WD40-repeat-containing domain protein [Choanephora cucurbitarum]